MASALYIRSVYTLLSSMCFIENTVKKAKELGYTSIALTDKNVLAAVPSFYNACVKYEIKAIFGLEVDLKINDDFYSVLLYAKDNDGLLNLMKLSSIICTSKDKYIDLEVLNKYRDHNFLVLFSDNMPLEDSINDYIVALVDNDLAINKKHNKELKFELNKKGIKTIAFSRTYYLEKEDYEEFEILKCIKEKRFFDKNAYFESGRHLLSLEKLNSLYEKDDLKNSDILANLCNATVDFKTSLPEYKTPNNVPAKDYLVALCKEGLKRRCKGDVGKEYIRRLEYELSVIIKMNFENYFLIVYDFILYAKKKGIVVGPGRGSAAGSLVSYCLGITEIDPLKYNLLFERFLNPERISMPDIDTDFPDNKRNEVVAYVKEKYGVKHVGHIITYGTLKVKQVLRDVGRVLRYPLSDLDMLCKLIPFSYSSSLVLAYQNVPVFRQKIDSEERFRYLFKVALKFEGFPRHESTHAAGIVFSSKELDEVVPIINIETDLYSTQYTAEYLESMGLIKMDLLGIRNLSIIAEVVDDIKTVDINNIPLDDEKTFELIKDVNLLGVFQLESSGMQALAKKMRPNNILELSMMIALFRPGPMENIPTFLENRANPKRITYLVPELRPILEETYGVILYQEQIMTIARRLAGFSYGKADVLRRAMSKKKASELEKLRPEFIRACVLNGYGEDIAIKLYDLIFKFANYGFNKSHSVAYGLVAYKMAYLKANYPLYFYKALLNGTISSSSKTYDYIKECKKRRIEIKGVSINKSKDVYTIENNSIIMPFGVCKDVGNTSSIKICKEREKGFYKDYISTVCRLVRIGVDKNVIENLIAAGAFDEFGSSRFTYLNSLTNVLKYASVHGDKVSLLDNDDLPLIKELRDDKLVRAQREKDVLGFYFSFDPLNDLKEKNNINTLPLKDLSENFGDVKGFGMIKKIKQHKTKKGDLMCFVDIYDDSGDLSLVLMPYVYNIYNEKINGAKYIYFEGKIERAASVLVKKLETF